LQWARRRAGMTQHELARATLMPQPSIARIEAGSVVPRTATLIRILHATGHKLSVEPIGPAVDSEAIRRQLAMEAPRRTRYAIRRVPVRVLRRLRRYAVPFVLIGELAEVAHGSAATVGRDIEVCVASTDVARERLKMALDDPGVTTDRKHLHVVTETAAGDDYDVLAPNAVALHVEAGMLVRVAALEDLIRARRARCTPKDREAALVLEAIMLESD
jgi:transcriptional regulator with XRE-family HTH domain